MKVTRTAMLGVAGAALVALFAAAATSPARPDGTTGRAAIDRKGPSAAAEAVITPLRQSLHPTTRPRQPARNLFGFHAAETPRPSLLTPAPTTADSPSPAPAPPPLKLVGLAEDAAPGGVVRTAIISGLGQLFLVKEGEELAGRYRVGAIGADAVELVDRASGSTLRLGLK